mmetsp:Transcript_45540/g.92946  ORF Transcript_45540/g.92946 Transcript_45540/m.92946 type:complete len:202 (+) Transcript_45540:180-785(+)
MASDLLRPHFRVPVHENVHHHDVVLESSGSLSPTCCISFLTYSHLFDDLLLGSNTSFYFLCSTFRLDTFGPTAEGLVDKVLLSSLCHAFKQATSVIGLSLHVVFHLIFSRFYRVFKLLVFLVLRKPVAPCSHAQCHQGLIHTGREAHHAILGILLLRRFRVCEFGAGSFKLPNGFTRQALEVYVILPSEQCVGHQNLLFHL